MQTLPLKLITGKPANYSRRQCEKLFVLREKSFATNWQHKNQIVLANKFLNGAVGMPIEDRFKQRKRTPVGSRNDLIATCIEKTETANKGGGRLAFALISNLPEPIRLSIALAWRAGRRRTRSSHLLHSSHVSLFQTYLPSRICISCACS